MTLEEKIKAMLAEEQGSDDQLDEKKKCAMETGNNGNDDMPENDPVELNPKKKKDEVCSPKKMAKEEAEESDDESVDEEVKSESSVSEQVSALLSAEGLSEDFRMQAVTIFEAAVADRVLQIEENLKEEYENLLEEAKAELAANIDGYLTESVNAWAEQNKVELENYFKAEINESLIDGMRKLFVEHNIDIPDESVPALELEMEKVEALEEAVRSEQETIAKLQEQINEMKKEKILESFVKSMTQTESDRFSSLVESIEFVSEEQYKKQLTIVKENFGLKKDSKKEESTSIVSESVSTTKVSDPVIESFAQMLSKQK